MTKFAVRAAVLAIVMAVAAPAQAGPFREGIELYDAYNFEGALLYWRSLAADGNIHALSALNDGYYAAGASAAEIAEATAWTRASAAEDGNWKARIEMGVLYLRGQGVPRDAAAAARWFDQAAGQGGIEAVMLLASMYRKGVSVDADGAQAENWLVMAASQGHAAALLDLGRMYLEGNGVARDDVQAFKWFAVAAARLEDQELRGQARMLRDTTALHMTPAEIARAERLAQSWRRPE